MEQWINPSVAADSQAPIPVIGHTLLPARQPSAQACQSTADLSILALISLATCRIMIAYIRLCPLMFVQYILTLVDHVSYPDHFLVVWNMFYFPIYWESSSQLTNSYFSEGFVQPPTRFGSQHRKHRPDHVSLFTAAP